MFNVVCLKYFYPVGNARTRCETCRCLQTLQMLYTPVSHNVPVQPSAQVQVYPFITSTQLPEFWQGSLTHSSISAKSGLHSTRSNHQSNTNLCQAYFTSFTGKTNAPSRDAKRLIFQWLRKVCTKLHLTNKQERFIFCPNMNINIQFVINVLTLCTHRCYNLFQYILHYSRT